MRSTKFFVLKIIPLLSSFVKCQCNNSKKNDTQPIIICLSVEKNGFKITNNFTKQNIKDHYHNGKNQYFFNFREEVQG